MIDQIDDFNKHGTLVLFDEDLGRAEQLADELRLPSPLQEAAALGVDDEVEADEVDAAYEFAKEVNATLGGRDAPGSPAAARGSSAAARAAAPAAARAAAPAAAREGSAGRRSKRLRGD